jgi:hypothetical protein
LKTLNRILITGILAASSATPALAVFDGQVLVGQRQSKVEVQGESENITGKDLYLGLHLDPIPVIPVAFGLYYLMQDYKLDKDAEHFAGTYLKSNQIGAEVSAWLPFDIYNLVPFVKLGYSFYGNGVSKTEDVPVYVFDSDEADQASTADLELNYGVTGTHFGIGLRWEPIAIVAGVLELDMGNEKYAAKEITIDSYSSKDNLGDLDLAVSSMAIRIGFQVGL